MTSNRPDAVQTSNALINNTPVVYTYMVIPRKMQRIIPKWLWEKKVQNVGAQERVVTGPSVELFKAEAVDVLPLLEDFGKRNMKPFHIHLMVRQNGSVRTRVSWLPNPLEVLGEVEIDWVVMMYHRFVWDTMAHRSVEGTGHLPPNISINSARPTERDQATSVQSVQILRGELALIYDPDAAVAVR